MLISILLAVEPVGGHTAWSLQGKAYDYLPSITALQLQYQVTMLDDRGRRALSGLAVFRNAAGETRTRELLIANPFSITKPRRVTQDRQSTLEACEKDHTRGYKRNCRFFQHKPDESVSAG